MIKKIRALCKFLPKMSTYGIDFDKTKFIPFSQKMGN